jgi:hypothetical protein
MTENDHPKGALLLMLIYLLLAIDLSASLLVFYPHYAYLHSPERDTITLEHLPPMSSGLEWRETITSYGTLANDETRLFRDWAPSRYVLSRPIVVKPGTQFDYNGGGTAVLADIVVRATHTPLRDFAHAGAVPAARYPPVGMSRRSIWPALAGRWPSPACACAHATSRRSVAWCWRTGSGGGDRSFLHVEVGADRPDHGVPLDRLLHPKRGIAGPHGVILMGDGRSKERHDPVAHHLVDRALVGMDGLDHALEDGVEKPPRLLGVPIGKQLHRAFQVGEEDRHLLPLALEGALGGEDLLGKMSGGVRLR